MVQVYSWCRVTGPSLGEPGPEWRLQAVSARRDRRVRRSDPRPSDRCHAAERRDLRAQARRRPRGRSVADPGLRDRGRPGCHPRRCPGRWRAELDPGVARTRSRRAVCLDLLDHRTRPAAGGHDLAVRPGTRPARPNRCCPTTPGTTRTISAPAGIGCGCASADPSGSRRVPATPEGFRLRDPIRPVDRAIGACALPNGPAGQSPPYRRVGDSPGFRWGSPPSGPPRET
jgi:hypothetical protein